MTLKIRNSLIIFSFLLLGINTLDWVSRSQAKIERAMAWGLVGIGAYLFQYLPFKMVFWEESIFHVVWNNILMKALPTIAESAEIEELLNIQGGTATILPWALIGLMVAAIIIWDALVQRKKATQMQNPIL